jgi:hypothetical protein
LYEQQWQKTRDGLRSLGVGHRAKNLSPSNVVDETFTRTSELGGFFGTA